MDTSTVLLLEDISISFNGVKVLSHASFSLKHNEVHAIVGKNGAGKSSFMKVVTGVYTPTEGNIFILNEAVKIVAGKTISQQKVAMVYQDLSLVPSMTVLQNIFLSHHPYRSYGILHDKKARERAIALLQQVGLPYISPDQLVQNLSAGEAQLVEIAKAMSSEPKIIVFDEPTASLSDLEIQSLFETIERLKLQGVSIIYITHYLEDVMKICDRVTVLRNGAVISTASVSDTNIENIITDMLGEEQSLQKRKKIETFVHTMKPPYLEIKNACTKKVGPINLKAFSGEIIGIAGLLGSGRTELFKMLYGLDTLSSGSIHIQEKEVSIKSPKHAVNHGIMLVPEERRTQGLVLDFSIEENMSLPNLQKIAQRGIIDAEKHKNMAEHAITSLQIKTTGREQVARFLSGGNQQKVVLGKCLAGEPTILLLDDPTFGVDIHAKTEIMHIIKDFARAGNIVLFISSEFSEIAMFCDRTYIVKKQTIKSELQNDALTESELLVQVQ